MDFIPLNLGFKKSPLQLSPICKTFLLFNFFSTLLNKSPFALVALHSPDMKIKEKSS